MVKWCHAKLLVGQRSVLASRRSVAVVGIVPEGRFIGVSECWQDGVDTSEESFILYEDNKRVKFDGKQAYLQ